MREGSERGERREKEKGGLTEEGVKEEESGKVRGEEERGSDRGEEGSGSEKGEE